MTATVNNPLELERQHGAHNYHPLPVVITEAEGSWVTDVEGRRYLDCLAGYSALNFGHRNPRLVASAIDQLGRVTLTSRAFHHDQLGPFCAELAELTGKDVVLPMNSGAEAVETALKIARRWGHLVKGIPDNQATIIVAEGNFHGRTISIVSFSSDPEARDHYGPYTPGFRTVAYGDIEAMAEAIDATTVGVLIEPIQGEGGVIIPPDGYLREVRELCDRNGLLMFADEIQSGLGRTGRTFACERENVVPDAYILGKALGGGIMPVSAVAADHHVMDVMTPGSHGSTFGGNPLAMAIGREVVAMLKTGEHQARAAGAEGLLRRGLEAFVGKGIERIRVVGMWVGIDLDPELATGRELCEALMRRGVLAKDTHGSTIRLSPPLTTSDADLEWAIARLGEALDDLRSR